MRVFGSKRIEPTDEDLAALARLSAVAARFKPVPSDARGDVEEPSDLLGEPEAPPEAVADPLGEPEAPPDAAADSHQAESGA